MCPSQDIGGEDRPISDHMLGLVDFVCPNESELIRLTGGMPTGSYDQVKQRGVGRNKKHIPYRD